MGGGDLVGELAHVVLAGEIRDVELDTTMGRRGAKLGGGVFAALAVASDDQHGRTRARQADRGLPSDAAGGAGDQADPASRVVHPRRGHLGLPRKRHATTIVMAYVCHKL